MSSPRSSTTVPAGRPAATPTPWTPGRPAATPCWPARSAELPRSLAYAVGQVRDSGALDDRDRAVELHRLAAQVAEVRRAGAEDHRDQVDAHLVQQAGVQALPGDLAAVHADVPVAGDLPRRGDRGLDALGDEHEVLVGG